jgi:m7GpppX diphosphatase
LGTIQGQQALLTLEKAAFPDQTKTIVHLLERLAGTTNLGANDIYRWYMSNLTPSANPTTSTSDLKLNLIYPCTPKHIAKYSRQRLRHVTETPQIYVTHVLPWARQQRLEGRLDWIFNILEGRTEQEDVVLRSGWDSGDDGFLLLPDLNWDRKTVSSLHLLALVQRRDIWSLRDLRKRHVPWLRHLREQVVKGACGVFAPGEVEGDELKCYVHYQPTYYHFHVHVVHVMLEPEGGTQSIGKAWELGVLISTLAAMPDDDNGLHEVDMSYVVGEESELWKKLWAPLKEGTEVSLNSHIG